MAIKKDKITRYAQGMFVRQEQYAQRVKTYYNFAVGRLLDLARQVKNDIGDEAFRFADHIGVRDEATEIIRRLYSQVYQEIRRGVEAEWEYANLSCDAMVMEAFGKGCKENDLFARFFERNRQTMEQFFKRRNGFGGLNLSQRVWKYTSDLRNELENAITVSLGEGVSASTMSRRVRQYLQEPERLYRRVRGADGKLHLSKAAKAYHPGQGVYRSSYKNAMRLTRTETNAAYRLADEDRWQRMDFVVGMRVHKSNNHPTEDICDILAGDYPKDFKFSAWHPQCRCYVTAILCTKEEMIRMQKNILAGKDKGEFRSVNEVRTVPKAFKDWVENNQDRIVRAKALPYFLRDNGKIIDGKWVYNADSAIDKPHYISEKQFEKLSNTMSVTSKEKYVLYDSDDLYIDSSWSRTINSELAEAKVGKVVPDGFMDKGSLEQIRTLDAVIEKNTLPEDMWLYRKVYPQWLKREGVDFSVGSIVHEYGFTSTSAVEGANVMRKGKDVLLEIHAPKGTKAFVSANSAESEVILPRNSKFKVVAVSERSGKKVVRLEVWTDDNSSHKFGSSSLYETKEAKRKAEEALVKPENNKPITFSKRQKQNHKELEEAIGVKQGEQMTIPEADYGKGNAYHGTDALYDENCTLVSFAYELRRRGFPVTAFKATEGSLAWDVGDDYKLAWEKPRTVTLDGNKRAIHPKVLDSHTHKEGRYHLFMDMKVGYSHTIIAERLKDGTLIFLDEQDNSKWSISFLQNVANLEIFKVDEMCINPSVAKELVQPYYGEKIKKKKR